MEHTDFNPTLEEELRSRSTRVLERLWTRELKEEEPREDVIEIIADELSLREAGPAFGGTERDQDAAVHRDFGGLVS